VDYIHEKNYKSLIKDSKALKKQEKQVKGLEPTPSTTTKKGRKKQRGIPCS
jgi:hypothetical protein